MLTRVEVSVVDDYLIIEFLVGEWSRQRHLTKDAPRDVGDSDV